MAGIVQHKSGVFPAPDEGGGVLFDNPVTKGNLIVAVFSMLPVGGFENIADSQNNGIPDPHSGSGGKIYSEAIDTGFSGPSTIEMGVYYAIAGASGTLEVVLTLEDGENSGHLHIYEVEGYTTPDQVGQNFQASTENAAVSTAGATIAADEFVIAVFGNKSGTLTWTLGGSLSGEESTNEVDTVASGGEVVNAKGVQTATASASSSDDLSSVIVTFYKRAGIPGPFLGSVIVSESDTDLEFPFLGSVSVISAPPDGNPTAFPFLGRVKLVTGQPSNGFPPLGTVVVLEGAPDGNPDGFPYLGTVESV